MEICAVLQDASSRGASSQEPSLLRHLQGGCANLAAGGDWDGVDVLNGAILALANGNGNGEGSAKGRLRALATVEMGFDGRCYHCGAYGRRKAQCRHLDVEMAARATKENAREKEKACATL